MLRSTIRCPVAPLLAFAASTFLSGCEPIRSQGMRGAQRRIEADRASAYESYLNEAREGVAADEDPKSIFRANRRSGGLSSEAREIEHETFNIP